MQEGLESLNGYARIFAEHVALSGHVPQISVITGTSAGGRVLLAGADGLRGHDRGGEHVPHCPAVVREVTGERVFAREFGARRCTAAMASVTPASPPTSTRSSLSASCC
jgi:methylmalonyl-CoA carboxyltransferase large subunit